jgi:hypothetical protein
VKIKPTGKAHAGAPVFYDAAIWPNGIVSEPDRNLILAEVWRTGTLLRLDVYRVQPTECGGLKVICCGEFPVIRALIGRTGSAKIAQMAPAAADECTWALAAIRQYRLNCNWDKTEPGEADDFSVTKVELRA